MKNRVSLMCSAMAMAGVAAFGTGCAAEVDDPDVDNADEMVVEGEGEESIAEAEAALGWGSYGVFHDGRNFGGRWMMVRHPYNIRSFRDFRDGYWDNRISSFRVHNGGRFRLYDNYGWGGRHYGFDRDIRNLYDYGWDNRARSLRWY
jgi:hypothetical protein